MMTVYLLGHKVGDIEEPVLYVRRQSFDYNDNLVTQGLPNPFVDSLTHDSIIVQIPRLQGQKNNRLDKVLSIFDQTQQVPEDKHVLNIDESIYADDMEMQRILQRLLVAASNAKMRHDMNVEDEYFSVIEKRDTTIMIKDKKIAEQTAQINEQTAQINEQTAQINEQTAQINEQTAQINEQTAQIKKSVQMLYDAGMSAETIAVNLGMDLKTVEQIIT